MRSEVVFAAPEAVWLSKVLQQLQVVDKTVTRFSDIKKDFTQSGLADFDAFWFSDEMEQVRAAGLLVL